CTMRRTIRDAARKTRPHRARRKPGKKPPWPTPVAGQLPRASRRRHKDAAGNWLARVYLGHERYHIVPLGVADDFGQGMTHAEAQRAALAQKAPRRANRPGGPTVADAIERHVRWLRSDRPAAATEFERTAERHILPVLGAV